MTPTERLAVVAEAQTWLKTPYADHGAAKGAGADCALMPLAVYSAVLPRLPKLPLAEYTMQWWMHRDEEKYLNYVRELGGVEIETPEPGDFALWKVGRVFSHGAIVIEWPKVIHAVNSRGVIYSDATIDSRLTRRERLLFTL